MALSKFTSQSLRNVFVAKGLTSVQHGLCFTQRLNNSQIVAQHIRKTTPLMASNTLMFARTFASDNKVEGEKHIDEAADISTYRVSPETIEKLKAKGITSFFPIQYETYDLIYDGFDLVGRARTGTGKTLSFALPILEKLKNSPSPSKLRGRKPRVLIMSPTRELAKQIASEIEGLSDLSTITLYGGTPTQPQEMELRSGVDVVVGTPGRIQDLLERGTLSFEDIQYVILDEADEMLRVGFQEALDYILGQIPKDQQVQRLLFSATIPRWVSQIASQTLKKDHKVIDLIGDEIVKSSETITHYAIECSTQHQLETLADVVRVYSQGGNTLVFAKTKREATEIATTSSIAPMCQVLHGDISQDQREITLNAFKKGKFTVLVATDVAARGLDIPKIDLVINCQPPEQPETYIHRVGRTGRAGRSGTAITFYVRKPHEREALQAIESHVGVKMSRIGTPQLSEIVKAVYAKGKSIVESVDAKLIESFTPNAKQLISEHNGDSVSVLAAALAHLSGYATGHKNRSLLSGAEGYTTLLFKMKEPAMRTTLVMDWLRNTVTGTKEARLTSDGNVIVDVVSEDVDKIVGVKIPGKYDRIDEVEVPTVLPEVVEDARNFGRERGGGYGSRFSSGDRYGGGNKFSGDRYGGNKYGESKYSSGDRYGEKKPFGGNKFSGDKYGEKKSSYAGNKFFEDRYGGAGIKSSGGDKPSFKFKSDGYQGSGSKKKLFDLYDE